MSRTIAVVAGRNTVTVRAIAAAIAVTGAITIGTVALIIALIPCSAVDGPKTSHCILGVVLYPV